MREPADRGEETDRQVDDAARPEPLTGPIAGLSVAAYAKVNLSLEILGRRPDGYHEIVSVTQLVSLADRIEVTPAPAFSIEMEPPLVDGAENLAARAAGALAGEAQSAVPGRVPPGLLRIRKAIPLAAGLGGGSSDAAATLRLLDRFWGTRLGRARLARIGAALGSDVPLFLAGGTSLIRGRGEIVEPLAPPPPFWLVLICPGGAPAEKTRALYQALQPDAYSTGAATLTLADGLRTGRSVVGARLVNTFDGVADRVYPGFPALRARLARAIGRPVYLTGAGPSVFATFARPDEAREAAQRVFTLGHVTIVARSIAHRPPVRRIRAPGAAFGR